jgi:hypothetical protein
VVKSSIEPLPPGEYRALLRRDFVSFAQRCFRELNPRIGFAMSWHIEIIAAQLTAVHEGKVRRLIVNLPPRHLKSLLASIAFPAWCLGHDPSAQILCVSYAQDLADKLSRDCRHIVASDWYRARRRPHHHRRPLKARGGLVANPAPGGERLVRPHPLQPIERQAHGCDRPRHAPIA